MVDSFFWEDPDTLADKEEEEMQCYYNSQFRVGICLANRKKCSDMQCFAIPFASRSKNDQNRQL